MTMIAGCGNADTGVQQDTTAKAEQTTAADGHIMQGTGQLDGNDVEILRAKLTKNHDGQPVLIVSFKWTNNTGEAKAFDSAFFERAFQNGILCNKRHSSGIDGYNGDNIMKQIQPGISLEVQRAYILGNAIAPVEIEVMNAWSFSKPEPKVIKTFAIAQ
jgi:hypothetical protein